MSKTKNKSETGAVVPDLTSLRDLEAWCAETLELKAEVRGRKVRLAYRRLTQVERRYVEDELGKVLPRELPAEKPGDPPRYDVRDPDFARRVRETEWKLRAWSLVRCFAALQDAIQKEAPPIPLSDAEPLARWLDERKIEPELVELMWRALQVNEVLPVEQLGFRSGDSSRPS